MSAVESSSETLEVEVFPGAIRCLGCGYNMEVYTAPDRSLVAECRIRSCEHLNTRLSVPRTFISCGVLP